jgi:hypothetical protein
VPEKLLLQEEKIFNQQKEAVPADGDEDVALLKDARA